MAVKTLHPLVKMMNITSFFRCGLFVVSLVTLLISTPKNMIRSSFTCRHFVMVLESFKIYFLHYYVITFLRYYIDIKNKTACKIL